MIIPVAVEKLVQQEFAKIGSRQEALQTISPSLLNIFYYPIVDFFLKTRLFQQPPLFATSIWKWRQNPLRTTYLSLRLTLSCKPSSLANFGIVAHAPSGGTIPCKT